MEPVIAAPSASPGARPPSHRALANRAPLQAALGFVPLVLAFIGLYDYPVARGWLGVGLVAYALAGLRWPALWLCVVPALIPLLDLAPWSGRLYLQDLDFFLLVTLALCLWHGHYRPSRSVARAVPWFGLCVFVYACSYAWSLYAGMAPLPPLGPNAFSSYFSNYNALRVARGFGWALLLWPSLALLFRRDRRLAAVCLFTGVSIGLLGTGLVALWERGVWHDLLHGTDIYGRLRGLLDFSTLYRITGLFSSMHTGGEAIDGYLALAWPLALGLVLCVRRRPVLLALGAVALPLGLYSAAVTFSRASYLALGLGLLCLAVACVSVAGRRSGPARAGGALAAVLVFAVLAMLAYPRGGTLGLLAVAFAFGLPALVAYFVPAQRARWIWPVAIAAALVATFAGHHAMVTSKWSQVGALALPLAALLGGGAAAVGPWVGRVARTSFSPTEFVILALVVAGMTTTVVPALMGYRMSFRFAGVGTDLQTRIDHWRDALGLIPDTTATKLFGVGLGVFPRRYHLAFPERSGGIGFIDEEGTNAFMRLTGGKDLKWTQRVDLPVHTRYTALLDYRLSDELAMLRMRVCRRHLIHPTEYNGQCRELSQRVKSTGGEWQTLSFDFDIGSLGASWLNWTRAPLLFEVTNRREYDLELRPAAIVDIDNVRLLDAQGVDWIANGTFSARTDRWFPLYDFNHLPWHIKNMAVAMYFDQGLTGSLAFIALVLLALAAGFGAARRGDPAGLCLAVSMTAFLGVGLVGTMLDEPRLMLMFFLFAFAAVANRRALARVQG